MRAIKLAVVFPGLIAGLLMASAGPAWAACHAFTFSQNSYSIGEGGGAVTLTVSRDFYAAPSHIEYATQNISASAGDDYTASSGTVSYTGTQVDKQIVVPIKNDTKDEANETFRVVLKNPGGCEPNTNFSVDDPAMVTITDNDTAPVPAPTRTGSSSPKPKTTPKASTPASRPTATGTPSPSPTPTPSETPTPTPTDTETAEPLAQPDDPDSGGLSGGALAGIVAGVIVLGGAGALLVRRRFLA